MPGSSASGGDRTLGRDSFPTDGLPSRPMELDKAEQGYWTVLLSQIPNHILRRIDSHQLRSLCELLAAKDRIAAAIKANPTDLKATRIYLQIAQQINRSSVMFGLSPIDRQRMKIDAVATVDDADEWLAEE